MALSVCMNAQVCELINSVGRVPTSHDTRLLILDALLSIVVASNGNGEFCGWVEGGAGGGDGLPPGRGEGGEGRGGNSRQGDGVGALGGRGSVGWRVRETALSLVSLLGVFVGEVVFR
jgi:hypothetical protein